MFSDLKPKNTTAFWNKHVEFVTQTLKQLNTEVFDSSWRIISPYSSLYLPEEYPPMSQNGSVGLTSGSMLFIAVCPEPDEKTFRIYGASNGWGNLFRRIPPERVVEGLRTMTSWILVQKG